MTGPEWDDAVRSLHKEWDSPDLWPRIRESMESRRRRNIRLWAGLTAAVAACLLLIVSISLRRAEHNDPDFLTEGTIRAVEAAEAVYLQSIDKLARAANARLHQDPSPLMNAYAERLALIDAAIADLRAEIDRNAFHTHLRAQASLLYRQKQQTLEEILRHDTNRPAAR